MSARACLAAAAIGPRVAAVVRAASRRRSFAIAALSGVALAGILGPPAFGQAAGQWKGPEHIWNASCGYCHGGGVARELRGLKLPADAIRQIVRRGSTGMPVFHASELSDADLSSLARWLEAAPAPSPPAQPTPAQPAPAHPTPAQPTPAR